MVLMNNGLGIYGVQERRGLGGEGEGHPRLKHARAQKRAPGWVGGVVCVVVAGLVWSWCGTVYGVATLVLAGACLDGHA